MTQNETWAHGRIDYLQLPALDIQRSATFYEAVFGWSIDPNSGSFEAPGMIGQLTTDLAPAARGGPVLWISADSLSSVLSRVESNDGRVRGRPQLDGGERCLVEIDDPAGNRIGLWDWLFGREAPRDAEAHAAVQGESRNRAAAA